MVRLAFSTNAFKQNTLDEAINSIAQAGYAGVEIMADVPHAYPPLLGERGISQLAARIAALHLQVSNVNAFTHFADGDTYHPTWIESDAARRNVRIQHTHNAIAMAARLGGKTVSLQPGGPLIGTDLTPERASAIFAEGLRQVLPDARRHGITLAVEPEPGLLIETSEEYGHFKQTYFADEPLVRMNCDIGHLFCVGDDPAAVIRRLPGEIAHVHLEDIGENRVHQHMAPGKGVIDFAAVFEALRSIDYAGWVTVELYPYETTAANVATSAIAHLQPMLAASGA